MRSWLFLTAGAGRQVARPMLAKFCAPKQKQLLRGASLSLDLLEPCPVESRSISDTIDLFFFQQTLVLVVLINR